MTTTASNRKQDTARFSGLTAIIDYAILSHGRAIAVLLVTAVLSFLPGFFQIPPTDRDEARFAQSTKQMLESGEYVDIHFQDEVRYKKPVGIYWLQAAVVKGAETLGLPNARVTIWLYRLPSLIGAVGAVLLTYWTALAFVSRRAATLAGLLMATSVLLGVEARLAKTDAVLLFTVLAAMGSMARAYLDGGRSQAARDVWMLPAIFWTALAAGILIKGPLIVMFAGLTVLALAAIDRSIRWFHALRPVPGVIWLCILVLPWFLAIATRSGSNFYTESIGRDLLRKLVSIQEAHGGPPGTYFVLFWATFWPGATLAALAAPGIWAARREKGAKFLLCWIVPAWIALEIVITKLPHYVLPLYPAIAILIAGVIDPHVLSWQRWLRRGASWFFLFPLIFGTAMIVMMVIVGRQLGLPAWPFVAAAMIFGLWAWWLFQADGPEHSLLRAMVASILIAAAFYGILAPSLTPAFPSAALAAMVRQADCRPPMVAAAGYQEPSLVFLIGTETAMVDGTDAADFLRPGGCRFALVESRHERSFLRRADALGLRYASPQRFDGYNYSTGQAISIAVYRSEGVP
jgi:4-amino-4-deoxy-L-arabinose transferase-like glycosyltransferase